MCVFNITTSVGCPIYAGPAAIFIIGETTIRVSVGGAMVIQPIIVRK